MDAFGLYALAGALLGYILGDIQREFRFRRDVRANLALAVDRTPANTDSDSDGHRDGSRADADADAGADSYRDRDSLRAVRSIGDGQARRRAVSRADVGNRSLSGVPVRAARGAHASALRMAGHDCG